MLTRSSLSGPNGWPTLILTFLHPKIGWNTISLIRELESTSESLWSITWQILYGVCWLKPDLNDKLAAISLPFGISAQIIYNPYKEQKVRLYMIEICSYSELGHTWQNYQANSPKPDTSRSFLKLGISFDWKKWGLEYYPCGHQWQVETLLGKWKLLTVPPN